MRSHVSVALAALALLLATSAVAEAPVRETGYSAVREDVHRAPHHSARYRAMHAAWRLCSNRRPTACLRYAALKHYVSYSLLYAIARCESRLDPRAANRSGASGLMQFMYGTFAGTPYGRHSIWSARWNALAGAWLIRRGGTGPWASSSGCWG